MSTNTAAPQSSFVRLISGKSFGLAQTYWTFYLVWAAVFFVAGSLLVAERNWPPYLALLVLTLSPVATALTLSWVAVASTT